MYSSVKPLEKMKIGTKFRLLVKLAVRLMSTIYLLPDADEHPYILITQFNACLIDPSTDLIYLATKTENYYNAVAVMASMYGLNLYIRE